MTTAATLSEENTKKREAVGRLLLEVLKKGCSAVDLKVQHAGWFHERDQALRAAEYHFIITVTEKSIREVNNGSA